MLYFTHSILNYPLASILQFNALDLVVIAIFTRGIFVGRKSGLLSELIKLLGVITASFLTLHNYIIVSDVLASSFFVPDGAKYIVAFVLIATICILPFYLIRKAWILVLEVKVFPPVDRWGGLTCSLLKCYVYCALVTLAIYIGGSPQLKNDVRASISGSHFKDVSVNLYQVTFETVITRFFKNITYNDNAQRALLKSVKSIEQARR